MRHERNQALAGFDVAARLAPVWPRICQVVEGRIDRLRRMSRRRGKRCSQILKWYRSDATNRSVHGNTAVLFRPYAGTFIPEHEVHQIVATSGRYFVGDFIGTFEAGNLMMTGLNLPQNRVSDIGPNDVIPFISRALLFRDEVVRGMIGLPRSCRDSPKHSIAAAVASYFPAIPNAPKTVGGDAASGRACYEKNDSISYFSPSTVRALIS